MKEAVPYQELLFLLCSGHFLYQKLLDSIINTYFLRYYEAEAVVIINETILTIALQFHFNSENQAYIPSRIYLLR